MKKILILLLLSCATSVAQIDFENTCAINIVDNDSIVLDNVTGYSNAVMLQSGTYLKITRFQGTTTFLHGFKALEEEDDYEKPTLILQKCRKKSKVIILHPNRINVTCSCCAPITFNNNQVLTIGN